jgi:hypothetical protein
VGSFRKVILSAVVTLSAFSAVIYSGCKDKCGSTTCQNGGTCLSNACECPAGYSGTDCGTAWSTPYVGTYTCQYTSSGVQSGTWQSVVTTDATDGGYVIDITDFASSNIVVVATVDSLGADSISHMLVVPTNIDSSGVTGVGTYSTKVIRNGQITVTYSTTAAGGGHGSGPYTFTMNKQ